MIKLTEPQRLMLEALRDANGDEGRPAAPRELAIMRWPDSPAWKKRTHRYGTNANGAVGGTMPMKAATVLWKLHGHGLASKNYEWNLWTITDQGRAYLDEHRQGP